MREYSRPGPWDNGACGSSTGSSAPTSWPVLPVAPGIYRLYDATGALVYVGKARNLRRRLAQYRTATRIKKDRKHRALVRSADRIEWQACASELEASLTEIRLIQEFRPPRNVAGAFPFLYPFSESRSRGWTRGSA